MQDPIKWHRRFLELARDIASWSKDTTKFGAIIVGPNKEILSTGYNGFPYNIRDDIKKRNDNKYIWTVHAEMNALLLAARRGTKLEGATIYVAGIGTNMKIQHPCAECVKAMIQAGIAELICTPPGETEDPWKESVEIAQQMLMESGLKTLYYNI